MQNRYGNYTRYQLVKSPMSSNKTMSYRSGLQRSTMMVGWTRAPPVSGEVDDAESPLRRERV